VTNLTNADRIAGSKTTSKGDGEKNQINTQSEQVFATFGLAVISGMHPLSGAKKHQPNHSKATFFLFPQYLDLT